MKKVKTNYLLDLYMDNCGYWNAEMYNIPGGYYHTQSFLYYPKNEVLWLLRNKYDCTCPHDAY